jgi:hypothetical protein
VAGFISVKREYKRVTVSNRKINPSFLRRGDPTSKHLNSLRTNTRVPTGSGTKPKTTVLARTHQKFTGLDLRQIRMASVFNMIMDLRVA